MAENKGSFAAMFEAEAAQPKKRRALRIGDRVDAVIVQVGKDSVFVEVDGNQQAFFEAAELRDDEGNISLKVGDKVKATVVDVDQAQGLARLSASFAPGERSTAHVVPGALLRGAVTGVRDFGAFVDLGGVEGLIPRSEISYDRSAQVSDALKPGDTVEVQVLDVKDVVPTRPGGSTKKITLSLKALAEDPWANLPFGEGRVIRGTVVRTADFGRFVRIGPGVEGLLHVSELGKNTKADDGEEILVAVKKIDKVARKISLVLAPEGAAEGSAIATKVSVQVGAVVHGVVDKIETFGIFVQIDGSTGKSGRGLVPQAELGVPRGTDLRKAFPIGAKVSCKVLETGEGKIRLSIKGAKDAEERADFEAAKSKANAPASLGTFADLLKKKT